MSKQTKKRQRSEWNAQTIGIGILALDRLIEVADSHVAGFWRAFSLVALLGLAYAVFSFMNRRSRLVSEEPAARHGTRRQVGVKEAPVPAARAPNVRKSLRTAPEDST